MSETEASRAIRGLTDGQKYALLCDPYKPGPNFVFPKVLDSGCYRSFKLKWLDKHPWLVYR